jgi:hypothetical protein
MMETSPLEQQSSDPRYLLTDAPLPPPVQKAVPPPQSSTGIYENDVKGDKMEIDVA